MSTFAATRTPFDLGAVNEAIGYARTAGPSTPPPQLDERFWWHVDMHVHGVALDAFFAALAFNDDLPWDTVRHHRDEEHGYTYSCATVKLPHAWLTLYSEHCPLDDTSAAAANSSGG